jgi:hypothetical protein
MAVGGQLHILDALPCGKEQMVPVAVREAGKSRPTAGLSIAEKCTFLAPCGT